MNDEIMLIIGDDGVAEEYKTNFDITIHCESKEDQEQAWRMITERQWTPYSERPPETDDVYLVTVHPDYVPQESKQVDRMYYYKGAWRWLNEKAKWEKWPDPIIAWMPLPEPYKEKTEE